MIRWSSNNNRPAARAATITAIIVVGASFGLALGACADEVADRDAGDADVLVGGVEADALPRYSTLPRQSIARASIESIPVDVDVKEAVLVRYRRDAWLRDAAIRVTVSDGIVSAQGTVETLAALENVARVALEEPGVRAVIHRVELRTSARNDDDIQAEILERLQALLPGDHVVAADVQEGVVTVRGVVEHRRQYRETLELIRSTKGVTGVDSELAWLEDASGSEDSNELAHRVVPSDAAIEAAVKDALFQDPRVVHTNVRVFVDEGEVQLVGTVGSDAERSAAVQDALYAHGVLRVKADELQRD